MNEPALRIAFVVVHTSPLDEPGTKDAGGMNVVVRAQAAELARRGHTVSMITRRSAATQADAVELAPGLTVYHLDAGPAQLLAKGDHEALVEPFRVALAAHLHRHPADLLHAEHWYSGVAGLPVARELGIPFVQSFHSIAAAADTPLSEGERPEAPGRLKAEQDIARAADLVVTVSEAERRTVIERLGADPERVRIANPGVDTEVFRPCSDRERAAGSAWIAQGGRPEVLVAGRLHPLKGFDVAIAAVAAIPAEIRPTLRIVGASPPDGEAYARELYEQVAAAGMLSTTSFDGALQRHLLAERLRHAMLVLIPSHSETFGLVALEAAASGVPVLARSAGGLCESVVSGRTGWLLDSADPEVWARRIREILADADELDRVGRAARAHALECTWATSTRMLLQEYDRVLLRVTPERAATAAIQCGAGQSVAR